jgi:hypothetical protein
MAESAFLKRRMRFIPDYFGRYCHGYKQTLRYGEGILVPMNISLALSNIKAAIYLAIWKALVKNLWFPLKNSQYPTSGQVPRAASGLLQAYELRTVGMVRCGLEPECWGSYILQKASAGGCCTKDKRCGILQFWNLGAV